MITVADAWTNPGLPWLADLVKRHQHLIKQRLGHGDLNRWIRALNAIPEIDSSSRTLGRSVGLTAIPIALERPLEAALLELRPWRKGPFQFGSIYVDAEWRSDLKWDRLCKHIALDNHRILDVGSGCGYHLWRMLEAGASEVLGIDPNILFHCQFSAVKCLIGHPKAASMPVTLEEFDAGLIDFDTVVSMGVLYHRKDPINHLERLKRWIKPGGQLILETLVVEGDDHTCFVPPDRYARMNNVWFLPSVLALKHWLSRIGFKSIECVDVSVTTPKEQRTTKWMQFESLKHGLDPNHQDRTIEGLHRPTRATLHAILPQH